MALIAHFIEDLWQLLLATYCLSRTLLNCLKYLLKFQLVLSIGNQCAASLQTFVKDGDYLHSVIHVRSVAEFDVMITGSWLLMHAQCEAL